MRWLNEPPSWKDTGDEIAVVSGAQTDFWRRTHDGGLRDSGHFYHRTVEGDFQAEVRISGHYRDLYDQAGLALASTAPWMQLRPTPPQPKMATERPGSTRAVLMTACF